MSIFEGTPRPDRPSATEIRAMMESSTDRAYSLGYQEGIKKALEVVKKCNLASLDGEDDYWDGFGFAKVRIIEELEALMKEGK